MSLGLRLALNVETKKVLRLREERERLREEVEDVKRESMEMIARVTKDCEDRVSTMRLQMMDMNATSHRDAFLKVNLIYMGLDE